MASGGEQKTVSQQTEIHSNEDEERETKHAFYEYMFKKATRDGGLSRMEAATFEAVREELVSEEEAHENGEAANLGRRLAEIGKRTRGGRRRPWGCWGEGTACVRYLGGCMYTVHIFMYLRCGCNISGGNDTWRRGRLPMLMLGNFCNDYTEICVSVGESTMCGCWCLTDYCVCLGRLSCVHSTNKRVAFRRREGERKCEQYM